MAAKWVAKAADGGENEAPIDKSDGLCIDKLLLLKFFEITLQEGKDQTEKVVVDLGLAERLPEERKTPATRIGQRDAKRERLNTWGSFDAADPLTRQLSDQGVQTPGGNYGGDAHPAQVEAMTEMHTAMMAYLSGMYGGMAYCTPGAGGYTTVMLRNIPNRYTRDMLAERLNASYEKQYDFLYLPIDFNSKCNMGYAFINFCTAASAAAFTQEFHGKRTKTVLPGFSSAKVCEVSYARVQGRDANMENLRDERFVEKLIEHPEWQPLFYDDDGKEVPFSKTLGTGGAKKKSSRAAPACPPGNMWPVPVPMMYPPAAYALPTDPLVTLGSVLPSATAETMLMLKEVPPAFTQEELVGHLDKSHKGAYDFLYLPKDSKAEGNRGFAFINFRSKEKAEQFSKDFNGVKAFADQADDEKPCEVTKARFHTLESSIARAQSARRAEGQKEKWGPVLVSEDGKMNALPLLSPSLGAKGHGKGLGADIADQGQGKKKKGEGKGKQPSQTPKYPPWSFAPANYMAAMMAAHTQARVAASKYAHGDSLLPKPSLFTPTEQAPLTEEKKECLFNQIQFYFSTQNLCKDVFLRQQMDSETGYVSLQLISEFPKVRKLGAAVDDIVEVIAASETLELDEARAQIRLRDEAERSRWKAPVLSRQVSEE